MPRKKKPAITPDVRNANLGTERGYSLIESSLRNLGAGRSILVDKEGRVIAGNKTFEVWASLANEDNVEIVHTNGERLVVVQRDDLDLSEPNGLARRLAYADNRASELDLSWNAEEILQDISAGMDLSNLWNDVELQKLLHGRDEENYTRKIETPIYEPLGYEPAIQSLLDDEKVEALISEIDSADISDDEKDFLRKASQRHRIFSFKDIAEYYAKASPEMQALMEKNGLVIIDYGAAVENGFVELTKTISSLVAADYGE